MTCDKSTLGLNIRGILGKHIARQTYPTSPVQHRVMIGSTAGAQHSRQCRDTTAQGMTMAKMQDPLRWRQDQLALLQQQASQAGIGVIIVIEGSDCAGKGGLVRRLCWSLDPHRVQVHGISAPDANELQQHWLQRFWQRLPRKGHIAIFDRSWYGRVLVERVEQFCTATQWQAAYQHINQTEQQWQTEGYVLCKLWLDISADTQRQRLLERAADPAKHWKLSVEDFRNRQHWDAYQSAIDDMRQATSTAHAPWHWIDANDKAQARLDAMDIIINKLSAVLGPPRATPLSDNIQHAITELAQGAP
jgi:polyphosphate kinase 2 (PPK2 family)